jgi:hypothetical protein
MKKLGIFGAVVLSVGLAGCQSPMQDMMNNNELWSIVVFKEFHQATF